MNSPKKPRRGNRDAKGRPLLVAKPFIAKGTAAYRIVERPETESEQGDDRS